MLHSMIHSKTFATIVVQELLHQISGLLKHACVVYIFYIHILGLLFGDVNYCVHTIYFSQAEDSLWKVTKQYFVHENPNTPHVSALPIKLV